MRDTRVALRIGLQIDHGLIRHRRLIHAAHVREDVAEQSVIERQPAFRHELTRDRFRFAETMLALESVAAQQERLGAAGLARIEGKGALLGQRVEACIKTRPRLRHEQPAELFEIGRRVLRRAHLFLAVANAFIQRALASVRSQRDGEWIGYAARANGSFRRSACVAPTTAERESGAEREKRGSAGQLSAFGF